MQTAVVQLVWDMDGTLLDSTLVVPEAFIAAVNELGGSRPDHEQVVAAYSLGVPEVILAHLLDRPLSTGDSEAYYRRLHGAVLRPYPGVATTLAALRAARHKVVVFTGAAVRGAHILLEAAGVEVDVLVGGDLIEHPKPAPDGLYLAAQLLGVEATELAYVGDARVDLMSARAAGACAIAAGWGHLYDSAAPADLTLTRPQDVLALLPA